MDYEQTASPIGSALPLLVHVCVCGTLGTLMWDMWMMMLSGDRRQKSLRLEDRQGKVEDGAYGGE